MDEDDEVLDASISTQAARLQEEEDSQFDLIQKLEREEGRHRELAERRGRRLPGLTGKRVRPRRKSGEARPRSPTCATRSPTPRATSTTRRTRMRGCPKH